MYELTYIVVPFLAGLVASFRRLVGPKLAVRAVWVTVHQLLFAAALLGCGVLSLREFLAIAHGLNGFGHVLFVVIVASRLALGLLPCVDQLGTRVLGADARAEVFRRRLGALQRPLGILTILTAVAMLFVRLRIYFTIF
ncbi:MAG: hypothetical protein U0610_17855 [bacterium]